MYTIFYTPSRKKHTHTLTKLVCCSSVWKGLSIFAVVVVVVVLESGRASPPPPAWGNCQTMTLLSMLPDTTMESSGDLPHPPKISSPSNNVDAFRKRNIIGLHTRIKKKRRSTGGGFVSA